MKSLLTSGNVSLLASLHLLPGLDGELAVVVETHLGGVRRVRPPSWRLTRGTDLLHHSVDLLKRKTLGLPNEEVGIDVANNTETTPDEEDLGLEITLVRADHIRGDDGDDTVPKPV